MFVLYVELRARIVIGNSLNVYVSGKLYRLERGVMHSMCVFFPLLHATKSCSTQLQNVVGRVLTKKVQ